MRQIGQKRNTRKVKCYKLELDLEWSNYCARERKVVKSRQVMETEVHLLLSNTKFLIWKKCMYF